MEIDFAGIENSRLQLHVHTDVDIGELCIHQGVDTHAADAGLETAGSGGLAVADFERGLYVVHGAELRRLQDLGVGVAEDGLEEGARNGGGEIRGGNAAQVG